MQLRAWRIEADAVSIVAVAANASDESLGLAVLLRGHAVEGTVGFPLNGCEWVGNDCDFSFLILGMKKPRSSFQTCVAHAFMYCRYSFLMPFIRLITLL